MSQTATPPTQATPVGARRRGIVRAVVMRLVLMLLSYNAAIAGYLWYLAREQEEDVVALYRSAGVAPEANDSGATERGFGGPAFLLQPVMLSPAKHLYRFACNAPERHVEPTRDISRADTR